MKKRILSMLLVAIMLLTLVPMSAFATGFDFSNYCLCGYINGVDYGTTAVSSPDFAHAGDFVFSADGKLTATFTADSYVQLKRKDGTEFYAFESYVADGTKTKLYEADTCNEKMFVPANTQLYFTLTRDDNGFFWLSYSDEDETSTYTVTNGTPQSDAEKNHGYIAIDKTTASEGDTVTVTVNPADGYKLKSLTVVPEAKTISTIADVLATVDGGFPQGTGMKNPPNNAWVCGSDRYTFVVQSGQNSALSFYYSGYVNPNTGEVIGNATFVLTTTEVTAGENCYTATSGNNTLTFNMTDGKLTGIVFSSTNEGTQNNYGGTYTAPAGTTPPSAEPETIIPEKQTDGTYQFTMPAYAVTVKAEFEKTITIADIIATYNNFPLTKDEDLYWTNEQGTACYYFNNNLFFRYTTIKSLWQSMTVSVVADGKNYTYSDGTVTYTFIMNEGSGVLTAITVNGSTDTKYNGTYVAPPTKYTVTNGTNDAHGNIAIDKASAAEGETVTITVNPAEGYKLKDDNLNVRKTVTAGSHGLPITLTQDTQDKTKYTFTMPAYNVTVTAEFEEKAITIADILPDDFPRLDDGFPEDTWTNENGIKIIIVEDGLTELFLSKIDFTSNYCITSKISETTLSKDGNNYSYSNSGVTVTFVMSDNELSNIMVQGLTGDHDGFNGTYKAPHIHSFSYSANANVITATCTDGCDKGYDTTPLTLTLTAPASLVYDGNAKSFTFADGEADAWEAAGLELPDIIYCIKQTGQTEYMPFLGTLKDVGNYMAKITVGGKDAQVEFTIDKATPYINTNPAPSDIIYGKKLADSTLAGGYAQVSSTNSTEVTGLFTWTNPETVPGINDSEVTEYDVTFTPTDTNNYNTVSCKVKIKVNHTHAPVLVNGQAATEEAAGWNNYYECDCGDFFEDATGLIPIENLAAWQAQGGNGYIAPLVHSITPVNGQDATDTEAGFKAYYECKSCGKYYEDATGLIPITDLVKWKAEDGNGYLAPLHGTDENHDHKCDYCGKQISEHNAILVEGTAATLQSAGHKSYYKCDCGKFFEDATCKVEITDLDAWKAAGGNGYIAKLEEEPTSPQTGDNSHLALWAMLMGAAFVGLVSCGILGKKRKNER